VTMIDNAVRYNGYLYAIRVLPRPKEPSSSEVDLKVRPYNEFLTMHISNINEDMTRYRDRQRLPMRAV